MRTDQLLGQDQLDYLEEMMNVGAGNAADVLSQMFRLKVEVNIPQLHITPLSAAFAEASNDSTKLFSCARMELYGDIRGVAYFLLENSQMEALENSIIQQASIDSAAPLTGQSTKSDSSYFSETANILVGSFMAAIQQFCDLSIIHSVPTVAVDMYLALLDEDMALISQNDSVVLVIMNLFLLQKEADAKAERLLTDLMMIPFPKYLDVLVASIDAARIKASGARQA